LHYEITRFLEYFWEFALLDLMEVGVWVKNRPVLVQVALGDNWPAELEAFLHSHCEDSESFRRLIEATAEIVYYSLYGAADNESSLKYLRHVMQTTSAAGVVPPPLDCFAASRFQDRHGWGNPISADQRDEWRSAD